MRPVIGIPCQADFRAGSQRPIYGNNRTYLDAVESAGGLPILIPMLNDPRELIDLLPRLDGIMFSGGIDLQASLYGEEKHPTEDDPDLRLDKLEIILATYALQEDIPVLAICRGMQMLNVLLGGKLYQDIASQRPGSLNHRRRDIPRTEPTHTVMIEEGSLMEKIMGSRQIWVNSLHHQAVKEPGKGIHISGWSEDGLPELMEIPGQRFVVGIQGHPEELYSTIPTHARLFQAFVRVCSNLPIEFEETHATSLVEATH